MRERVLAALATLNEADGAIIYGAGRVLAYRPPSLNGCAVLIDLDDEALQPASREPLRADARRHPARPGVE